MSAVLWLAVLTALAAPAFFAWRTWSLLRLQLEIGRNDDHFARRAFVTLLNEAELTMWICDDGNDFPESIYNTAAVIEAIGQRLTRNEALHVYCLFSSNDETSFTRAFAGHQRVHLKRGVQPRRDVHFKIIDDGRKGYVSAHPPESFERRYRSYDCSKVAAHIRQAALGRHLDSITGLFQEEARAVA